MNIKNNVKLLVIDQAKQNVLENLMNLYLHDLSEFADDLKINDEGRYEYNGLDYYFKDKELMPFFIYCNNEIAGFVLVNSGHYVPSDVDYDIHEIFVLKNYRGRGVAAAATKKVFALYSGRYLVAQLEHNKTAIHFWKNFYEKQYIKYDETVQTIHGLNCFIQIFNV